MRRFDHSYLRVVILMLVYGLVAPSIAQPFKEVSSRSGFSTTTHNNGVAVADYDNDNDLDVFVVSRWDEEGPTRSQLFRNDNNGKFTNVTLESGIVSEHDYTGLPQIGGFDVGKKMGAYWGDFDNDGYPDLLLTNSRHNELYHNNQDGTFTDITATSNIPTVNAIYTTGALWFDFDNDSQLDLYINTLYGAPSRLYRNLGNHTFEDVTESMGLLDFGWSSWSAIPWDINDDGYQDLYITRDFNFPNQFLINDSGRYFYDAAAEFGLTDGAKDGMGIGHADYNNDGLIDLYVTNINESTLFKNTGDGQFLDRSTALNVSKTGWGWSAQFQDFDHDLDLDLFVSNGFRTREQNLYYENFLETGKEFFLNRSSELGFDEPSASNGVAAFDYDNDGDLDLLIGRTDVHLEFFENELITLSQPDESNWIQVDLVGTASNRDAIGAVVQLEVGNHLLTRYNHGVYLLSQNQARLHFGLSDFTAIDKLTVKWPTGDTEEFTNLPINSILRITEKEGFEELVLTSNKIIGCTDPNSCLYNPDAVLDDNSCTYLEEKLITGASTVEVLSTHSYTFPAREGYTYFWDVEGGEILAGQGTSAIDVQWEIAKQVLVTVTEIGPCSSPIAQLPIVFDIPLEQTSHSVARLWNEVVLSAIRGDYARPTVHARNLFHTSIAMYDSWAIYDQIAQPYLISKTVHNYNNQFNGFAIPENDSDALNETISYALFRIISARFKDSPKWTKTQKKMNALMFLLGYDVSYASPDYSKGDPAALGNFIGYSVLEYGLLDGANEKSKYANVYYQPKNQPLAPDLAGNSEIEDPNHWQPLRLSIFIDQAGNPTAGSTPEFLSPEWGNVSSFSMTDNDSESFNRDDDTYNVFLDPGHPPYLNSQTIRSDTLDLYKWNFSLVSVWSSHLDPTDGVEWDISPRGIGNIDISQLPTELADHESFYDLTKGGDIGFGRDVNPITGEAYESQMVPRGDYTRVLAEFWADGPDSETPPGHWYVLLNYVSDHPDFERKFNGLGEELSPLEWDVKAYFTLGGAMHDASIAAWSVKGYYDYIRPISALRYMADQGQSTDPSLDNYHQDGIPLIENFIEVVKEDDPLSGEADEHLGKIKVYAWRGHSYVDNVANDDAGVGWILAENWWPYQRPTFVTPPFAGYVSGHSTFSRAAAEVLTLLTGSEYFPGGLGEFVAKKNEFLVFEEGPSQDVILQWATYRDASDQCSLSRIWGGIHPPADDIPGRLMGAQIGEKAYQFANEHFTGNVLAAEVPKVLSVAYPMPSVTNEVYLTNTKRDQEFKLYDLSGVPIPVVSSNFDGYTKTTKITFGQLNPGLYFIVSGHQSWKVIFE